MKTLPDGFARWLPPILLLLVAGNQLWLAHSDALSPWSGGGFGMFSTTDSPAHRHVHAFLENEGSRRELFIPRELYEANRRAATLPTRERLSGFADQLLSSETDDRVRWDALEIQVWGVEYEADSLLPVGVLLAQERFELAH